MHTSLPQPGQAKEQGKTKLEVLKPQTPAKKHADTRRPARQARGEAGKAGAEDRQQSRKRGAVETIPRLRIRMYRHGLGDCALLRFRKEDGSGTFNILIDCGLITVASEPKKKMRAVANDILEACKDGDNAARLDVVVMTHEHWDHVSGFHGDQARDVFEQIDIGEVWYAWTEDPRNQLGKRLREEREQKLQALASAVSAFASTPGMGERATEIGALLGFFGVTDFSAAGPKIGRTRDAFDFLQKCPRVKTRYLEPQHAPRTLLNVPHLRVYVLGPPQNEGLIKRSTPSKKDHEVYELASEQRLASTLDAAFLRMGNAAGEDDTFGDCPFDPMLRRRDGRPKERTSMALDKLMHDTWNAGGEEWRRIETDWTQAAETLALNLDSHTNNTCLVLAFEFTDTGDVMLFPADAQVGNWRSWQDLRWNIRTTAGTQEVTGPDLLSRTVFYKVGHHGSHNATLRELGLEQMSSEDLIAFIPVNKEQARKNRWMAMPFNPLVKRLGEKTYGRLLIADEPKPGKDDLSDKLSAAARKRFDADVEVFDDPETGIGWFELRFL